MFINYLNLLFKLNHTVNLDIFFKIMLVYKIDFDVCVTNIF